MKKASIAWIVLALVVVVGAVVWMNKNGQPAALQPQSPAGVQSPVLKTGTDATLGTYLVAQNGMTLYRFTKDTAGVSTCTAAPCSTNWPAYTAPAGSPLQADPSVKGLLSVIPGTMQVTYNGSPLYFWHGDTKAGDTAGQGIGGVWFVVAP